MTQTFKIGDRVRYHGDDTNLRGEVLTIVRTPTEVDIIAGSVLVHLDGDGGYSVNPDHLKLAAFRAGDRVRYVGQGPRYGQLATVVKHDPTEGPVSVRFDNTQANTVRALRARFLERVTPDEEGAALAINLLTDAVDALAGRVEKLERDAQSTKGRLPVGTKVRWLRGSQRMGDVGEIVGYMSPSRLPGGRVSPDRHVIRFDNNEVWMARVEPMGRPIIEVVR